MLKQLRISALTALIVVGFAVGNSNSKFKMLQRVYKLGRRSAITA